MYVVSDVIFFLRYMQVRKKSYCRVIFFFAVNASTKKELGYCVYCKKKLHDITIFLHLCLPQRKDNYTTLRSFVLFFVFAFTAQKFFPLAEHWGPPRRQGLYSHLAQIWAPRRQG